MILSIEIWRVSLPQLSWIGDGIRAHTDFSCVHKGISPRSHGTCQIRLMKVEMGDDGPMS